MIGVPGSPPSMMEGANPIPTLPFMAQLYLPDLAKLINDPLSHDHAFGPPCQLSYPQIYLNQNRVQDRIPLKM